MNIAIKKIAIYFMASFIVMISLEFIFYSGWMGNAHRGRILFKFPSAIQESYINYILEDEGGYFRNSSRKCQMIEIIYDSRAIGIPLKYDISTLHKYSGEYMSRKFNDLCLDEPASAMARKLLNLK